MQKKVRSPKTGYRFEEKNKYRHKVWSIFAEKLDVESAIVLFLPSKEGLEIPIALSYGFKEENLIAVDDCPAVIATSKWRKEYPKIKFYGNTLSRAGERIKQDGIVLDAANLDLCGNISSDMIKEITGFIYSGCMFGESVISLTMLCGRESHAVNTLAELYLKKIDEDYNRSAFSRFSKRIQVMCSLIHKEDEFNIKYEYEGTYKSGVQKMSYGIFSMMHKKLSDLLMKQAAESLGEEINNYCRVRIEHRDFRYHWCRNVRHEHYSHVTGKTYTISDEKIKLAQLANDIYRVWLDKEKCRLENIIKENILNKLDEYNLKHTPRGFLVFPYIAIHHNNKHSTNWGIFYHNNFYDGCKGYQSQDYCKDKKKAEKYLNEINWNIRR